MGSHEPSDVVDWVVVGVCVDLGSGSGSGSGVVLGPDVDDVVVEVGSGSGSGSGAGVESGPGLIVGVYVVIGPALGWNARMELRKKSPEEVRSLADQPPAALAPGARAAQASLLDRKSVV